MKTLCAMLLLAIFALPVSAGAHSQQSDDVEVRTMLSDFIAAFDNLEWDQFRGFFADDATVFFPRDSPHRADGRKEFEQTFQQVFDRIRAGRTKGPYMDLHPIDLKIQIAGDVAIATFHLDDRPGFLNRRTIVLQRGTRGWKIIHLHASEVRTAN
jgi:ketosteroid isomerase-like protein